MRNSHGRTLIGAINKDYVYLSNRMTSAYEKRYGFYCDLYFPRHKQFGTPLIDNQLYRNKYAKNGSEYDNVNIFEPHESASYSDEPDVKWAKFYIPNLLKKENVNTSDLEFDSIFLSDYEKRPFIETSKKRELPIGTKVVVYIENSKMYFFVDNKLVVNGANGHMLLRMTLAPLLEEGDEGDIEVLDNVEY